MRRASLLVVLCACQQTAVSPSASLQGLRDMVRVGKYMVATSTERDELRVLDLDTGDTSNPRRYVRAPNPIQALSIPVLKRPTTLVTDTYYMVNNTVPGATPVAVGREVGGPYVYAASPGVAEISIVWAENLDPTVGFTEIKRLSTSAAVTAMAAQGAEPVASPDGGDPRPQPDTFYFATFDGKTSTLYSVEPAPPEGILAQDLQAAVHPVLTRDDQSIVDMVALPNHRLAVAFRAVRTKTGSALIVDALTGATMVTLQFPSPVRALYTHGEYILGKPGEPQTAYRPGSRIFGVLDEDACGNINCGGVVAVQADTGERTLSTVGEALGPAVPLEQRIAPPLTFGDGLIQSVGLTPEGHIASPRDATELAVEMLGMVTLSNGQIGFFNAARMQHLFGAEAPAVTSTVLPDGGQSPGVKEDGGVGPFASFRRGAIHDEDIIVVGEGVISGLGQLATDGGEKLFTDVASRALVGDTIDGCDGGTVTAIEPDGLRYAPVCASGTVAVRAATPKPYVVVGTVSGYMGRSAPGETFTFPGSYYAQYEDYDPRVPAMQLDFSLAPRLEREERFTLTIVSNYFPYVMTLTTSGCSAGATTLPGTIHEDPIRNRIFIAYPSANGIVEIIPVNVRRTALQESGISCWR